MATPTALPASFTAGQVLPASDLNLIRGAFRVLQVVTGSTSTSVSNSTTTPANTGLSATITPQYNTSKILVLVAQNGGDKSVGNAANAITMALYRGVTNISLLANGAGYTNSLLNVRLATCVGFYLDSPATTAATTYKTMFNNGLNAASVSFQIGGESSTMVLLEISA